MATTARPINASLEMTCFEAELEASIRCLPKKPGDPFWKDWRTRRFLECIPIGPNEVEVKFQLLDQQGAVGVGVIRGLYMEHRFARRKVQQDELEKRLADMGYNAQARDGVMRPADEDIQERCDENEIVLTLVGVDNAQVLTDSQQQLLRARRAEIEAEEWRSARPRRVRVPQLSL